jgi:hypothetical protein
MKIGHLQTTITTVLSEVDEEGNVTSHPLQPIPVQGKVSPETFIGIYNLIEQARRELQAEVDKQEPEVAPETKPEAAQE